MNPTVTGMLSTVLGAGFGAGFVSARGGALEDADGCGIGGATGCTGTGAGSGTTWPPLSPIGIKYISYTFDFWLVLFILVM